MKIECRSVVRRCAAGASCRGPAKKNVPQNDGVVVRLVMRREDQRDAASCRKCAELAKPVVMSMDLLRVAAPEFLPASGIMTEPPPQRRAGSNVLGPQIDPGIRLCYPAGHRRSINIRVPSLALRGA